MVSGQTDGGVFLNLNPGKWKQGLRRGKAPWRFSERTLAQICLGERKQNVLLPGCGHARSVPQGRVLALVSRGGEGRRGARGSLSEDSRSN